MEEQKYPQDEERNEYRYIDSWWLDQVATGLTAGAKNIRARRGEISLLMSTRRVLCVICRSIGSVIGARITLSMHRCDV